MRSVPLHSESCCKKTWPQLNIIIVFLQAKNHSATDHMEHLGISVFPHPLLVLCCKVSWLLHVVLHAQCRHITLSDSLFTSPSSRISLLNTRFISFNGDASAPQRCQQRLHVCTVTSLFWLHLNKHAFSHFLSLLLVLFCTWVSNWNQWVWNILCIRVLSPCTLSLNWRGESISVRFSVEDKCLLMASLKCCNWNI